MPRVFDKAAKLRQITSLQQPILSTYIQIGNWFCAQENVTHCATNFVVYFAADSMKPSSLLAVGWHDVDLGPLRVHVDDHPTPTGEQKVVLGWRRIHCR